MKKGKITVDKPNKYSKTQLGSWPMFNEIKIKVQKP